MFNLTNVSITQCINFYLIKENQKTTPMRTDEDFYVGSNIKASLDITNGKTIQFRDIVILGKFIVKSTNMENSLEKGSLVARNVFLLGDFSLNNVNAEFKNIYQTRADDFKQELQDIIIDWFKFQRESSEKIGLRSLLI